MTDLDKAKKIYYEYEGDKGRMQMDGVLEYYMEHHISSALEREWDKDLIDYYFGKMSLSKIVDMEYNKFINFAVRLKSQNLVDKLISMYTKKINESDDYSKFLLCRILIVPLKKEMDKKMHMEIFRFCNFLIGSISVDDLSISHEYFDKKIVSENFEKNQFLDKLEKLKIEISKLN